MKLLDLPTFNEFNSLLNVIDLGDTLIEGHLDAFSCRSAGADKKLYSSLDTHYSSESANSPSELQSSPFGPLSNRQCRKTLIFLISTMNHSFPDYDFSNVNADDFRKEIDYQAVVNFINTTLASVMKNTFTSVAKAKLWSSIDQQINLKECSIYSFIPDPDSDPFAEDGLIWSFNYFFYHKKWKRVIFFTVHACRKFHDADQSSDVELIQSDDEDLLEFKMDF